MKRKILIAIYIIFIIVTLKLVYNVIVNSIIISNYDKEIYSENLAKSLTFFDFPESYIANYNYGNILYQNGKYKKAILEYKKSLKCNIPKNKECNVRINYALAICKTVSVNEEDKNSIKKAIEKYESAIEILIQKGCASENGKEGHNEKAEQLKKDIQTEIDRLKKLQKNSNDENDENKEKEEEKDKENMDTAEEKLQNIKENATKVQRNLENEYKNYGNFDYNKIEKNW